MTWREGGGIVNIYSIYSLTTFLILLFFFYVSPGSITEKHPLQRAKNFHFTDIVALNASPVGCFGELHQSIQHSNINIQVFLDAHGQYFRRRGSGQASQTGGYKPSPPWSPVAPPWAYLYTLCEYRNP